MAANMTQILARLAVVNFVALIATFAIGVLSWTRGAVRNADDSTYLLHFYLGLTSVLATLALHCLVFIYFLGTGRWVKEVAIAYRIPDDPLPKLTRELKRWTFPPALLAMLVPIATGAAGMAIVHPRVGWASHPHPTLAPLTLL